MGEAKRRRDAGVYPNTSTPPPRVRKEVVVPDDLIMIDDDEADDMESCWFCNGPAVDDAQMFAIIVDNGRAEEARACPDCGALIVGEAWEAFIGRLEARGFRDAREHVDLFRGHRATALRLAQKAART